MRMVQALGDVAGRLTRRRGGSFDANAYWRRRYSSRGDSIQAVGNATLTEAQNEQDYDARWAEVASALATVVPEPQGRPLLDAGCGIGIFSRRYELAGYRVVGVDLAPEAAAAASELCDGEFMAGNLAEIDLGRRFDVVTCHGVLVCIVDDDERRAALVNLVGHLSDDGVIMLQEPVRADGDTSPQPPHVHFVTRAELSAALVEVGLEIVVERGFALPNEPSPQAILIARRAA